MIKENNEYYKVGSYVDRNYKIIKSTFVKAFNSLGVDITTDQWMLLDALQEHEVLSQIELANINYKNTATVSRIIDLLVDKSYVKKSKNKDDKRRYDVSLTAEGRSIVNRSQELVNQLREKSWDGLSAKDHMEFVRIMNKVYENFSSLDLNQSKP